MLHRRKDAVPLIIKGNNVPAYKFLTSVMGTYKRLSKKEILPCSFYLTIPPFATGLIPSYPAIIAIKFLTY